MSHKFTRFVYEKETPVKHASRCKCGATSGQRPQKWDVEDWERGHLALIEKVKAYLGTRTPSLSQQRDYYRTMATDPSVAEHDKKLWGQLADELDHRLNDGVPTSVQERLL